MAIEAIEPRTSSCPTSSSSSSSSPLVHRWKYEVFVSFRGEDVRKNFAAHLFHALRQAGIHYFKDNDKVETGLYIESKLLDAIRGSRISLIVFSTNYADSRWCLNELLEILECNQRHRDGGHVVLPVFYDVEPGEVRKQDGAFGDGFRRCIASHTDDLQVRKWRNALREAGNLSGWHLNNDANGDQSEFIDQIVGHLFGNILRPNPAFLVKNTVGVDSFVDDTIALLNIGLEDVLMVGIWGIKGIGKTTLAKIICGHISKEFEGVSFLENVGDANPDGLLLLQKKLLHDVLKVKGLEMYDLNSNINEIKTKLCRKRILLVLDNIDKKEQLEYFGAGDRDWLQSGSRILVTARDELLLDELKVDEKYMVSGLGTKASLQLLCRHAFREDHPKEGYEELSKCLVHYVGGLPIALKRFGSFLYRKRKNQWHEILEKLVRNPYLDSLGIPLEPISSVHPIQSVGPCGGHGGCTFDDKTYTGIRKIIVVVARSLIESFYIDYDLDGCLVSSGRHGGPSVDDTFTVELDYPSEFLTSVSGYIKEYSSPVIIQSLMFHSNRRTYGPFGSEKGKFFTFPTVAGKIIGFHGRCGCSLDSIGAYFGPIPHPFPFEVIGPFGESGNGSIWDDGKHKDVRQIDVVSGSAIESIAITYERGLSFAHGTSGGGKMKKIYLDWLTEYLTSISGYIANEFGSTIIHSLTFQSNKRTYGPFGSEKGSYFSFPATGGKIIGFYGSSGSHLESIGAYLEPVSHLYPVRTIGPVGGQGGQPWDDGKFHGVRKIKIELERVVNYILIQYDKNGESVWSSMHGTCSKGEIYVVDLDYPHEYLTSVSGYIGNDCGAVVIRSLMFQSNIHRYGPFGKEEGRFFSSPLSCSKVIGFHGRSGTNLVSLGVYLEPISCSYPLQSIEAFGGRGGIPWDDGVHTDVREITLVTGALIDSIAIKYDNNGSLIQCTRHGGKGGAHVYKIELDWPQEYLTSYSGYLDDPGSLVVRSLTFQSNKKTYGPFGEEKGRYFSLPSTGGKIVGFHGSSGFYLDSLGAHVGMLN